MASSAENARLSTLSALLRELQNENVNVIVMTAFPRSKSDQAYDYICTSMIDIFKKYSL